MQNMPQQIGNQNAAATKSFLLNISKMHLGENKANGSLSCILEYLLLSNSTILSNSIENRHCRRQRQKI